jgi:hypothetical protein
LPAFRNGVSRLKDGEGGSAVTHAWRVKRWLILLVALLLIVGVAGAGSAVEAKPDLVVVFPSVPYATQTAPLYVDTFTEPGALLFRFDAVLFNRGGTLDVYREQANGHVMQAIWAGGMPSVAPDPNAPPPSDAPGLTIEDLTSRGAKFEFIPGPDHNHFHFENAARYQLLVPGLGALPAAKIGFCFSDDFGTPPVKYFPYPYQGPGMSWCALGHPEATFFREGISPEAGDLYNSQVQYQWIDVTGLRPGSYTLRGVANPTHVISESDYTNNATTVPRLIPGVIATSARLSSLKHAVIRLGASVVAPRIPARASSACFPRSGSPACLVTDVGHAGLTFRLATTPCFGKAKLKATGSAVAKAIYSPPARTTSIDGFGYVAIDHRGLTSGVAFVRIGHPTKTGRPESCLLGGNVGPDRRAHLTFVTSGKLPTGAHWALFVDAHRSKGVFRGSTVESGPLTPGRTGFWLELIKNGHPLTPRVQSREITLGVPARVEAPG